jgi:hypothetical protein
MLKIIISIQNELLDFIINSLPIHMMQGKILLWISLTVITVAILILPLTPVYTIDKVKWKTFKEKNGLFTIKYPSDWSPTKPGEETYAPIDLYFFHPVGGSFVTLSLYADESILSDNIDLMDSYLAYDQSEPRYRLIQPTECEKYVVNSIKVCSAINTFRFMALDSKPMITQLVIAGIDGDGVEYGMTYRSNTELFEDFLPIVEEMMASFNVTGNLLSSSEELTQGAQGFEKPFSESPDIKGI